MERTVNLDFEAIVNGPVFFGTVFVEASFVVCEADPSATDSDWDAKGEKSIDQYNVYQDGKKVDVYISPEELYANLSRYLRNEDIQEGHDNEGGEF